MTRVMVRLSGRSVLCSTALVFLMFAAPLVAQTAKPDFSGVWRNNRSKSSSTVTPRNGADTAEAPSSPSSPVVAPFPDEVIEQKGSNVTITTKGPFDNVIEFTADGAEEVTDLGSGGAQRALLAYWDGNKLVTKMTMVRDGQIILQVKEVRYLLDGGKEMIVEKHAKMAQGEGDFHIVMNRKS